MSLTNFPNGITSFGMPVVGTGGMLTQGKNIFVKPSTGSNINSGSDPDHAVKTLTQALTLATANQNDTIYLISESNTASGTTDYQSTPLLWNKDMVHLVGISSGSAIGNRARIAQLSTATGVDGLITISANACYFANFSVFQGVADGTSTNAITLTGDRNYFYNVNVQPFVHQTQAQQGGLYGVTMTGAEENIFERCVIGADTIAQSTNANVRITADSRDNIFKDCTFLVCATGAGFLHVSIADDGLLGFLLFDRCKFINSPTAGGVTTQMTSCCTDSKALTDFDGVVLFDMPFVYGADQLGAGGAYLAVGIGSGDMDASTIGLAEATT